MCGSSMWTSTSSPSRNGSARSSTSSGVPSSTTSKWSIGSASVPSKWKWRPVSCSISWIGPSTPWPPTRIEATFGCTRIRNAGAFGFSAARSRSQRSTSIATVSSDSTTPSPSHAVGHVLARHLDEPERRDLDHVGLRPVLVERLAERLQHRVPVPCARHVDEVDDDDPADVAQPQLAHDLLGRLEVRPRDRVLELRALTAAGERPRVHVDDGHRLGVVDHQVAAARQVHPALQHRLDRVLDTVLLEQRLVVVLVELEPLEQLWRRPVEEGLEPVVLPRVVHDRPLELAREDVPRHAHRQIRLLEDHGRRGSVLGALPEHIVQLVQILDLALEVLARGALRGGSDDDAAVADVDLLGGAAHSVAFLVLEPA